MKRGCCPRDDLHGPERRRIRPNSGNGRPGNRNRAAQTGAEDVSPGVEVVQVGTDGRQKPTEVAIRPRGVGMDLHLGSFGLDEAADFRGLQPSSE